MTARTRDSGLISVSWAIQCCGEHLYSVEEQRIHDEMYHQLEVIEP